MATLTNTLIKNTYDALLKATDNDAIGSTAKRITDGLGNNTPLYISTTQVGIGITPTTELHVGSDAKIGGNLIIVGNLEVQGSTTTIDTSTLSVEDPLIILASNNTSDASDIGFYGKYRPSATDLYSGLFRDASDEKYHLFKNLETEPTTTVNTSGTGYAKADLVIGGLEATDGTFSGIVTANGFRTTSGSTDYSLLTRNSSNTAVYIQQAGTGNILDVRYGSQAAGQGTSAMVVNSSGQVGIGTISPDKPLHIAASGAGAQIKIQRTNTNTTGSVGSIGFANDDGYFLTAIETQGDGNDEGGHLIFRTHSEAVSSDDDPYDVPERMRIDSSGVVQVRNETPTIQLYNTDTSLGSNQTLGS